ncbi:VOC family protein [Piscinibacter sakaiensis]|uniref:VOC family protein n=1 Tax=Piscinibacter sakaiensis TaxID=1547922 RepID=UPI003AAFD901
MSFPAMALSHFELYVRDVASMERFYTDELGFVVTDRGAGEAAMVFLSRHPDEHHQIVLNPRPSAPAIESPVDHLSFRVASLAGLRQFRDALAARGTAVDAVSHGTSWSIYFRDPEGNRLEIFVDTPWHVPQPCRFDIDLALSDEQLLATTLARVAEMPGFCDIAQWRKGHRSAVG